MKPAYDNATTALAGRQVRVYWNVHRHRWSIQTREGGAWRVVAHADMVKLLDARFTVREAGRRRVLVEGRKNVHAWVEGTVGSSETLCTRQVRYNPKRSGCFEGPDRERVDVASCVELEFSAVYVP